MDDASLDDFLGESDASADEERDADPDDAAEQDAETDAAAPPETDAERDEADESAAADVEPAVSTYAWSGDAMACADCGTTVARRWRDDGQLVCAECKDW